MNSISRFFENFKKKVLSHISSKVALIFVVVFCIISLFIQYFQRADAIPATSVLGAVVVPFQEGVNEIGSFLFQEREEKLSLDEAQKEIKALKKKNHKLEKQLDQVNSLKVENEELKTLLLAKERYGDYEMEEAKIIGNDGTNSFRRFTINKGAGDGMEVDMNVINNDGLIGYISHVGLNYSIVTSIIEDEINVSAMTKNGHDNCIVSGAASMLGADTMVLNNALATINFKKDNTLVTSDISERFLPGLLIGYATDMKENKSSLTQSGYVTTAVNFNKLSEVLVITTKVPELVETEAAE